MRIAVTGSSGFIGKALVKQIRRLVNYEKLILIDKKTKIDILNKEQLDTLDYFDIVIHLAAMSYVPASFENPQSFYYTNVVGTLNVLELCRKNNARLIFISSYLYGFPDYLPVDENHVTKAFNPYGQSKLISEHLCQGYNRDFNIPIVIFRPFNVFGDGQNTEFLIPLIFQQIRKGEKDIMLMDPNPKRDFIYINDVVDAIIAAINIDFSSLEILNICSGESYSIRKVTEIINSLLKVKVNFIFNDNIIRMNEVNDTKGSKNKIEELLVWSPKYSLEDGLSELVKKYSL